MSDQFPYLPAGDAVICENTVRAWFDQRVYIDLGDSLAGGGEYIATLVGTDEEYLVLEDAQGRFRERMDHIAHMQLA